MENSSTEQIEIDPRKLAGLLADETRLRVVASIALGAGTLSAIKEKTGLDEASVIKALTRLNSAGLVDSRPDAGHRLRMEVFRNAARPVGERAGAPERPGKSGTGREASKIPLAATGSVGGDGRPIRNRQTLP